MLRCFNQTIKLSNRGVRDIQRINNNIKHVINNNVHMNNTMCQIKSKNNFVKDQKRSLPNIYIPKNKFIHTNTIKDRNGLIHHKFIIKNNTTSIHIVQDKIKPIANNVILKNNATNIHLVKDQIKPIAKVTVQKNIPMNLQIVKDQNKPITNIAVPKLNSINPTKEYHHKIVLPQNTCVLITNTEFDIVCVSLAREIKRKEHLNRILSYCKCNFKIFDAVDGNLVLKGKKNIKDYSKGFDLEGMVEKHKNANARFHGAIGLKLTNHIIMKEIEKSKSIKPVLILEDDADLEADFVLRIQNTLKSIDHDWDIILLSSSYNFDDKRKYNKKTGLRGALFFTGTYGFLINGSKAAKKLSGLLERCPAIQPIDDFYGRESEKGNINVYAFTPHIVSHLGNVFESTIPNSWHVNPIKLQNSLYALTCKK